VKETKPNKQKKNFKQNEGKTVSITEVKRKYGREREQKRKYRSEKLSKKKNTKAK
jgi:hypothetical protein